MLLSLFMFLLLIVSYNDTIGYVMFPVTHLISGALSSNPSLLSLSSTKKLHALIAKTHLSRDPFHVTHLLRLYAFHGLLRGACRLFEQCPNPTIFLWNALIRAHARAHRLSHAFSLFARMLRSDVCPDGFTYACLARACSEGFHVHGLRVFHAKALVFGFGSNTICGSAFVRAYSKMGLVGESNKVFDGIVKPDLVLWNSIISGYGNSGGWAKGLELFNDMMRSMGEKPDGFTFVGLLLGVSDSSLVSVGQLIHGFGLKCGFEANVHVGSALVSMYSKCKLMNSALKVFCGIFEPDLVTWSALITGFSQSGEFEKALFFFKELTLQGKKPDSILTASLLAVASQMANVKLGVKIHACVVRQGLESDVMVGSALIDMYSKSGYLRLAIRVFETMPIRNIVSYNSLILGFGLHGLASKAFEMFEEAIESGLNPDGSTFSALLCACSHSGLVDDGKRIFRTMREEFSVEARTEHYVHLVKLVGMNGELEEALSLIRSLPEPVDHGIWGALLACCEACGDFNLADIVAQKLIDSNHKRNSYRVMLSNIYASDGRWVEAMNMRDDMREEKSWKTPGVSWIGRQ